MMQLGEIAKVSQHGANTNVMLRARDAKKLALAKREVEEMLERAASTIKERLRSDYESGGQEFESLRARQLAHSRHICFVQRVGELLPRPARRGSVVEARTVFARYFDRKLSP
jgi:hypothetical protein